MISDAESSEFDWDGGNAGKNRKHRVEDTESEEAFFDGRKVLMKDALHSHGEERFILLGKTKGDRLLFIVFTKRKLKIRVISARQANKKEIPLYEKAA